MNPLSGTVTSRLPIRAGFVSVSEDARFALVTRRIIPTFLPRNKTAEPEREIPAEMVRLSDLSVVDTITLSGFQLDQCAVSSDGLTAAFEGKHLDKVKRSIVIYDMKTRMVIASKRTKLPHRFQFMPDNQTLLIPKSFIGETAPVDFWKVRE